MQNKNELTFFRCSLSSFHIYCEINISKGIIRSYVLVFFSTCCWCQLRPSPYNPECHLILSCRNLKNTQKKSYFFKNKKFILNCWSKCGQTSSGDAHKESCFSSFWSIILGTHGIKRFFIINFKKSIWMFFKVLLINLSY